MRLISHDELSPRIVDRIRHTLRPGWSRSVLARRTASVCLVVAAVVVAVAGHRGSAERTVVVTTTDLMPGHAVAATDLAVREIPGGLIPTGALRMTADAVGRTVAGSVRSGEILTDSRLLSTRLPARLVGRSDARLVPVELAEQTVTSLLREGDVVDVLAADDTADGSVDDHERSTAVLARGAVVALTRVDGEDGLLSGGRAGPHPILLAMAEASAHRVAAAGLDTALAVVVH
ncbi:SAF domain-containing protein [Gordonia sp. CPCC 206044]|uniref:SAF domain-containing protein n=1 Tax=Gordonia sp. CPCC 206044 TaxID=3140793 RepID=UPI003AF3E636